MWFGNDDYHPTNNLTGGNLPAMAWQKFMAYAHTNIDIKPVFGVDFVPEQTIIADADADGTDTDILERPPSLTPEAARKLVILANMFKAERETGSITTEASAPLPAAVEEL